MKDLYVKPDFFLKRLEKGDEKAYMYLVDTYYDSLFDYAKNLSRDAYRADDIVQNVFIRVWENRGNLKKILTLKPYLFKSVYNEFITLNHKDVATTALEKKYIEEMDAYLTQEDGDRFERLMDLVKREIDQLPPKCRETFLLSRSEGLSYVEIAQYLKVSQKTVEHHMSNAFRILREKIGEQTDMFLFQLFGSNPKLA